jgi:hypothetical protein
MFDVLRLIKVEYPSSLHWAGFMLENLVSPGFHAAVLDSIYCKLMLTPGI